MNIEEAIEEFSFFNEGDYITRNMEVAKDIVLTAYEKEKEKAEYENELRIKYQKRYDSVKEKNKELEKENNRLLMSNGRNGGYKI